MGCNRPKAPVMPALMPSVSKVLVVAALQPQATAGAAAPAVATIKAMPATSSPMASTVFDILGLNPLGSAAPGESRQAPEACGPRGRRVPLCGCKLEARSWDWDHGRE